jgi:sRNA-binding regulator protein Hfq
MKDFIDSPATGRSMEGEVFGNRRLIRPSMSRNENRPDNGDRRERGERAERAPNGKKTAPPEQTHAENFYYQKQMQSKTAMVVVLQDDEEIHGVIEWYDKYCLKINRNGEPNLLIYKPSIKYMYKESESVGRK